MNKNSVTNVRRDSKHWMVSSSSDPEALAVVDGFGRFATHGPHYSRRTPGSKTFTGVGQEVVFITKSKDAVWAVVRQRTPSKKGSGVSRGRRGVPDPRPKYVWRNMLFRNLSIIRSSILIQEATLLTYQIWLDKYGELPHEILRTEIDPKRIRSINPGCCYKKAGYKNARTVRGKLFLEAPSYEAMVNPNSTIITNG